MPHIEPLAIPYQEYRAGEDSRLMESELVIDGLYTSMYALRPNAIGHEAVKAPTRLKNLEQRKSGLYLARLAMLDEDLLEKFDVEARFDQGYWTNPDKGLSFTFGGKYKVRPKVAYLRSYSDQWLDSLMALTTASTPLEIGHERLLVAV